MSIYQYVEDVYISLDNHEVYHTKEELNEAIEDINKQINNYKQKLFGLCCGNSKDLLYNKDCEEYEVNPIDTLQCEFNSIFEEELCGLEYLYEKRFKLYCILDNFDRMKIG